MKHLVTKYLNLDTAVRFAIVLLVLGFAGAAAAQAGGSLDALGGGMWDAVCEFTRSKIVAGIAAVALITLIVLWMLDEARGFISTLLKIGIGIAIILNIATILQLLGLQGVINC